MLFEYLALSLLLKPQNITVAHSYNRPTFKLYMQKIGAIPVCLFPVFVDSFAQSHIL